MSSQDSQNSYSRIRLRTEKERRRSRVRGIKNAIIAVLILWIICSIAVMAFLTFKIISLENKINEIAKTNVSVTNGAAAPGLSATEADDSVFVSYDGTAESNLAGLEDTIKVYLTFDDGPSNNTDAILDVLDDYGVKATFFVQGKDPEEFGDRYRRIVDEGHTIGMHTFSHSYSRIYSSLDSFAEDVVAIRSLIYDTTGVITDFYRFPGGSSNRISGVNIADCISYLNSNGIRYYDWNVASNDATSPPLPVDTIVENVLRDVVRYKTSIVLLHDADDKATTVEALPVLIERLQQMGAIILPISEDTTLIQHVTLND